MMKLKRASLARVVASGLVLAAFGTTQASADVFDFSFLYGTDTFSFSINDQAPNYFADGLGIDYGSIAGIYNNSPYTFDSVELLNKNFFSANFYTGNLPSGTLNFNGPQLYTGSESSPVISIGNYNLTGLPSGSPATLKISRAAGPGAPAPEVGMGLLSALVAGLGLALTRMRSNPLAGLLNRRRAAFA